LSLSRFSVFLATFRRRPSKRTPFQQAILGTWKLVSYVREELPSGAESDVMGAHPSGYINYGRDGRMIVMIVGSDRKKPAGAVATPAEAEALTARGASLDSGTKKIV
jgi:hypothetical protein